MRIFKIGPSELGWLRSDCERCLVRQIVHGIRRPGGPPDAFNLADSAMKRWFQGDPDKVHHLGVGPPFSVIAQGLQVESQPLSFPEFGVEIVIKGRLDALVSCDNETWVVDYKTTSRAELAPRTYSPQLHAYAFALEQPAGNSTPRDIDGLALLIYRPEKFACKPERRISGLYGPIEWLDVPRDQGKFLDLLRKVAALLSGAEQPAPNQQCAYCVYFGAVPYEHAPVGGAA